MIGAPPATEMPAGGPGRGALAAHSAFAAGGYMLCSSLMLVVNKLAVFWLPAPSTVLLVQFLASVAAMYVAGSLKLCEVEPIRLDTARRFILVPIVFLGTVFANIKALQFATVETLIVFRASTPLIIALLDYQFLGRELPSVRSWLSLGLILTGAFGYVLNDQFFHVKGYFWVAVWYAVFVTDQVYIKHAISAVKMSPWTRVYYTNLLATPLLLVILVLSGEIGTLITFEWEPISVFWLAVSALLGVAIAYFSFLAREAVSATYFTVIGNVCKVLTVFINVLMWKYHATPLGLGFLFLSLFGAARYEQSPMRANKPASVAGHPIDAGGRRAEP